MFLSLFSRHNKPEKRFPRRPQINKKKNYDIHKNTISVKKYFLQYIPCEDLEFGDPGVEISTQQSIKKNLERNPKQ